MFQQERIIRYVMGEMDEAEQLRIEEQYFTDAEFLSNVQAVCEELIDAYLTGSMPASDRTRFEKRLYAVPFLQEQVAISRALMQKTAASVSVKKQVTTSEHIVKDSWREKLNALFPRFALAGAMCTLLLAGVWYWWQGRVSPSNRPDQPATQIAMTSTATPVATASPTVPASPYGTARPTKAATQPLALLPVIASILLATETTRSEKQIASLGIPSSNGIVRLQLELPAEERQAFQAVLQNTQGKQLQSWPKVIPTRYETAALIELRVSAQLLAEGEYTISLSQGPTPRYQFRFAVQPEEKR